MNHSVYLRLFKSSFFYGFYHGKSSFNHHLGWYFLSFFQPPKKQILSPMECHLVGFAQLLNCSTELVDHWPCDEDSKNVFFSIRFTPWKMNMEHNHWGLIQIIFLSKWVMAVGSSHSSSRVYLSRPDPTVLTAIHDRSMGRLYIYRCMNGWFLWDQLIGKYTRPMNPMGSIWKEILVSLKQRDWIGIYSLIFQGVQVGFVCDGWNTPPKVNHFFWGSSNH